MNYLKNISQDFFAILKKSLKCLLFVALYLQLVAKIRADGRYDQAVVPLGYAKYDSTDKKVYSYFKDVNGTEIKSPVELTTDISVTISASGGSISGARHGHEWPGAVWIQNPKMEDDGKFSLEICSSSHNIFKVDETCVRTKANGAAKEPLGFSALPTGGFLAAKFHTFGYTNPGDIATSLPTPSDFTDINTDSAVAVGVSAGLINAAVFALLGPFAALISTTITAINASVILSRTLLFVHKDGYVYKLFNDDCPYDVPAGATANTKTNCINYGTIISGQNKENNCILLRDYYMTGSTYKETDCPCGTYEKYDATTNKSTTEDRCDSVFMYKSDDDKINATCYGEWQIARQMYSKCSTAVSARKSDDVVYKAYKDSSANALIKDKISGMYGRGSYVCGYIISSVDWSDKNKVHRAGCVKTPAAVPPRPYPRIAVAEPNMNVVNSPAAHMFAYFARLRPFRAVKQEKTSGSCEYGDAELGELYRGTFFRPKITLSFGATERVITFTPKSSMTDTYGDLDYDSAATSYVSSWQESAPLILDYTEYDQSTCAAVTPTVSHQAKICTRIEYDTTDDQDYYVAYQYDLVTSVSAGDTCAQLATKKALVKIGKTKRPPLKYSYVNGMPKLPISVAGVKDEPNKIKITIDPLAFPETEVADYHSKVSSMSDTIVARYYDYSNKKYQNATQCTILFTHKYCAAKDGCNVLSSLPASAKNAAASSTDGDAVIYREFEDVCRAKTNCSPDSTTIAECQSNNSKAGLLNLQSDNLSSYKKQNQWQNEICLSSGFAVIDIFDAYLFGGPSIKREDYVVAYASENGPRIAVKKEAGSDPSRIDAFFTPSSSVFSKKTSTDIINAAAGEVLAAAYEDGTNLAEKYFGPDCADELKSSTSVSSASCMVSAMTLRTRTMKEFGLCTKYEGALTSGLKYDDAVAGTGEHIIYVPIRCQYMLFTLVGAGGSGAVFTNNNEVSYYTGKTAPGSGGGTVIGAIKLTNSPSSPLGFNAANWLKFIVGTYGSKTYTYDDRSLDFCGWHASLAAGGKYFWGFSDSSSSYIKDFAGNTYVTAEAGKSNMQTCVEDKTVSSGSGSIDSTRAMTSSALIADGGIYAGFGSFAGGKNQGTCYSGGPSAYNWKYLKDGIFTTTVTAECNCASGGSYKYGQYYGNGGCVYSDRWNSSVGSGGPGLAQLEPGHIEWNGALPKLDSDGNKNLIFATSSTKVDTACTSACPRTNFAVTSASGESLVCEYGGYGTDGATTNSSTNDRGMELLAGNFGYPTKCVRSDGSIVLPDGNFGVGICPAGMKMVNTDNKFYGACVSNRDNFANIQNEIMNADKIYFSGSGIYCNSSNCPKANYTSDVMFSKTIHIYNTYIRKCHIGGRWNSVGGTTVSPITTIASSAIKCPTINPEKVAYDQDYSLNGIWLESAANASGAMARCANGYIGKNDPATMASAGYTRACNVNGQWGPVTNTDAICVATCSMVEDDFNHVIWEPPTNYQDPTVSPKCMMGNISDAVVDGRFVATGTVQYILQNTANLASTKRRCIMPTGDILSAAGVRSTDSNAIYWDTAPDGLRCIAPTYKGICDTARHVCYDASAIGEIAMGHCMSGYRYVTNNLKTLPPGKMVNSNNSAEDASIVDVWLKTNQIKLTCSTSRLQANNYTVTSKTSYYSNAAIWAAINSGSSLAAYNDSTTVGDIKDGYYFPFSTYSISSDDNFMCYGTVYSFAAFDASDSATTYTTPDLGSQDMSTIANWNKQISNAIKIAISSDDASTASDCTLTSATTKETAIAAKMSTNGHCSKLCKNTTASTSLTLYSCTSSVPAGADCTEICYSSATTYYHNAGMFTTTDPGVTSNKLTYSASNVDACVGPGITMALKQIRAANKGGLDDKIGKYCKNLTFEAVISPSEIYTKILPAMQTPNLSAAWNNGAVKSCIV